MIMFMRGHRGVSGQPQRVTRLYGALSAVVCVTAVALGVMFHLATPVLADSPLTRADPESWGAPPGSEEQLDGRTKDRKLFALPDGRFQAVFGQDLHYEVTPGAWDDVNLDFNSPLMERNGYYRAAITSHGLDLIARSGHGIRWYTPTEPVPHGRRARFAKHGLEWDYINGRAGVKLQAQVEVPRGPQTYSFGYGLLGGAEDFAINADGDAVSGGTFTVRRSQVFGANGMVYEASAWSREAGSRIAFSFDDSVLPDDAYPYILDPTTTFDIAAAANDGTAGKSDTSYPPGGVRHRGYG